MDATTSAPLFEGVPVTKGMYHLAFVLVTCEELKEKGLLIGGPEIDVPRMRGLVAAGESAYEKPTDAEIQSIMDYLQNNL